MLTDITLFGVRDKAKDAIEILQKHEPPEGYYLAFSGGKDSLVCYYLCKLAGVKFDAHYNYTTIDPPELVRFVRTFDDVELHKPDTCYWQLIINKGLPPTRKMRYCCQEFKERGGKGRIKILGVREEESTKRKGRKVVQLDSPLGRVINIIYYWSEIDVWEFIGCNLIDYCSLYDEGFSRLGCIACPQASATMQEWHFKRWPAYRTAYVKCFDLMIAERKRKGLGCTWETGEDVLHWWMYGNPKVDKNQLEMEWGT